MHKIPETRHRGPLQRALPRFSVGHVPCDQPAITPKHLLHLPAGTAYRNFRVGQALPDKSGEDPLKRPSMAFEWFSVTLSVSPHWDQIPWQCPRFRRKGHDDAKPFSSFWVYDAWFLSRYMNALELMELAAGSG